MERILEPQIMEGEAEAQAYARADFAASNQAYVDDLLASFPPPLERVVDLGCGPAQVAVRLARAHGGAHITAVDGSAAMIALARQAVQAAGLGSRITLLQGRLPGVDLVPQQFDAVLSKDMLHHLPDPQVLWSEVRRLGRAGAAIFVVDLSRPPSPRAARAIVERVSADEDPLLKDDFFRSLCAAFTAAEVQAQLAAAGLPLAVSRFGERHLCIKGLLPG